MASFTQNNKIAVAALSIFFLSFSTMLFFLDGDATSPDYLKSDALESAMNGASHSGGHSVHFSESEGEEEEAPVAEDAHATEESEVDLDNLYRVITDNYDSPLFVLYPEGKVKFLSNNFVEEYGYEMEDMTEGTFFSYVQPEDLADFVADYAGVIQSGTAARGVGPYRFVRKDGGTSVHLVSLIPVVTEEGKVTEVIGCVKDITKKVEIFGEEAEAEEVEEGAEATEEPADLH